MEKKIDILELPPELRQFVGECELSGKRTLFTRNERPVAILVSYDEYLALRETIAIASDPDVRAKIDAAEEEVKRGAMLLVEDLLVE
jgi:PHD/YefM family antitoxin component YafN of YafNO toxin-antitoxin module